MKKVINCSDAIMVYEETGELVLIERENDPKGLALPGGKQEPGESIVETVKREVYEETGLDFTPVKVLGVYDDPDRDYRGRYVSTVFIGYASGSPQNETGKTKVVFIHPSVFGLIKDRFILDHAKILQDYLKA